MPLLQSTSTLGFVNIDWKASRHTAAHSTLRNMRRLCSTIADIVQKMQPSILCMCEVGEVSNPLTQSHMEEVAATVEEAWEGAATERVRLKFFFTSGTPYMTAYDELQVQCEWNRVLWDLYPAGGEDRTAQMFLCRDPSGFTVDIINVHAPSGNMQLKDHQRETLLRSLLKSNSGSIHGSTVGKARCVIGGGMNTYPHVLAKLLHVLRKERVLQPKTQVMESIGRLHGDLCIVGGFSAFNLTTTAKIHDPMHLPYGIKWLATPTLCATRSFWCCCRRSRKTLHQNLPPSSLD